MKMPDRVDVKIASVNADTETIADKSVERSWKKEQDS
jgi:hypothetical protein